MCASHGRRRQEEVEPPSLGCEQRLQESRKAVASLFNQACVCDGPFASWRQWQVFGGVNKWSLGFVAETEETGFGEQSQEIIWYSYPPGEPLKEIEPYCKQMLIE